LGEERAIDDIVRSFIPDGPTPTPPTPTPSVTPTTTPIVPTPSVTPTNTTTPTGTPTQTPTQTPTNTPSVTPTETPTNTPSVTPTLTPTNTSTPTPTITPTNTTTPTETPIVPTPSITPSVTPTNTTTPTETPTPTPTLTPTSSAVPAIPVLLNLDAAEPSSYPGSGTIWYDLSGNGNDADLYGSFDYVSSGISSYFGFTGDTSYSVISGFSISNNTSLEIMMSWYGPISGTYNRMWSTGPSDNFEIGVDSGGAISVYPSNGWQNFVSFFDSVGVCRHFVFTLDGTTMKVYRDGILVSTTTLPSPMTAGVDTYIATRYNNSEPTEIDVKYIKVYDAILDATQVATQYSNNSSRC
jgi:hypothetical protein